MLLACSVATATDSANLRVAIVHGQASSYQPAATAIEAALEKKNVTVLRVVLPKKAKDRVQILRQLNEFDPDAIASGGAQTTAFVSKHLPSTPQCYFMVPNPLDLPQENPNLPGISGDIDPEEQCDWIIKTVPKAKRIAILYSERSKRTAEHFIKTGAQRGLTFVSIRTSLDNFMLGIDTLTAEKVDGVLMLPDAAIYSAQTVQRLLVWGIREQKPIWTFSPKLVEAGALASVHPDVPAIGKRTAEIVLKVARRQSPSRNIEYAPQSHRAINIRTAELISSKDAISRLSGKVVTYGEKK